MRKNIGLYYRNKPDYLRYSLYMMGDSACHDRLWYVSPDMDEWAHDLGLAVFPLCGW